MLNLYFYCSQIQRWRNDYEVERRTTFRLVLNVNILQYYANKVVYGLGNNGSVLTVN